MEDYLKDYITILVLCLIVIGACVVSILGKLGKHDDTVTVSHHWILIYPLPLLAAVAAVIAAMAGDFHVAAWAWVAGVISATVVSILIRRHLNAQARRDSLDPRPLA